MFISEAMKRGGEFGVFVSPYGFYPKPVMYCIGENLHKDPFKEPLLEVILHTFDDNLANFGWEKMGTIEIYNNHKIMGNHIFAKFSEYGTDGEVEEVYEFDDLAGLDIGEILATEVKVPDFEYEITKDEYITTLTTRGSEREMSLLVDELIQRAHADNVEYQQVRRAETAGKPGRDARVKKQEDLSPKIVELQKETFDQKLDQMREARHARTKAKLDKWLSTNSEKRGHSFDYPFDDIADRTLEGLYSPKERGHIWVNAGQAEQLSYLQENSSQDWELGDDNEWGSIDWDSEVAQSMTISTYYVCSVNRIKVDGDRAKGQASDYRSCIGFVKETSAGFEYKVFVPTDYKIVNVANYSRISATVMAEGISPTATEAMARASYYLTQCKTLSLSDSAKYNFKENEVLMLRTSEARAVSSVDKTYPAMQRQARADAVQRQNEAREKFLGTERFAAQKSKWADKKAATSLDARGQRASALSRAKKPAHKPSARDGRG